MILFCRSLFLLLILSACAQAPTKVSERSQIAEHRVLRAFFKETIRPDPNLVVVDARGAFDFATYHVPGSINLDWKEFSQNKPGLEGLPRTDVDDMTRRLARLGVDRKSSVVVVGNGKSGDGEEGRLAWIFYYLGVERVRFADIKIFKGSFINVEPPPRPGVPPWSAQLRPEVWCQQTELKAAVGRKDLSKDQKSVVIDVRSHEEYFNKSAKDGRYEFPDLGAINIDWREFIDARGEPNSSVRDRLEGIGIRPADRIIVMSKHGVRSSLATMALLALGFENVSNFAGGWNEIVTTNKYAE